MTYSLGPPCLPIEQVEEAMLANRQLAVARCPYATVIRYPATLAERELIPMNNVDICKVALSNMIIF